MGPRRLPPVWTLDRSLLADAARGEAIANRLAEHARIGFGPGGVPPARSVRLFLQLCTHSTRGWLDYLARGRRPAMGYQVIDRYYRLLRDHVARRAPAGAARAPGHWAAFVRAVHGPPAAPSPLATWWLVFLAVRAHTRFDLADAIFLAYHDHLAVTARAPDMRDLETLLLGPHTDELFLRAAMAFCDEQCRSGSGIRRMALVRRAAYALAGVWLPCFQLWRWAAWREAQRWIARADDPFASPAHCAPRGARQRDAAPSEAEPLRRARRSRAEPC